jgi:imidazolonepropionase-like amidohydrolase
MMRAVQEAAGTGGEMFSREDSEDFAHMCRMLPKAARAGVRLCIGDDYGSPIMPHGWYGKELAVYAEQAAIPPLEVIRWATCNGGQLLGRNDVGTIEAGNLADMIIVNGDPSRDIRLLGDSANILTVIKDGAVVSGALPNPGAGIGTGRGKVRAVG